MPPSEQWILEPERGLSSKSQEELGLSLDNHCLLRSHGDEHQVTPTLMVCVVLAMLGWPGTAVRLSTMLPSGQRRGSAQERGIVITEPRRGQRLGCVTSAPDKEDSVLILARECKCPHCM